MNIAQTIQARSLAIADQLDALAASASSARTRDAVELVWSEATGLTATIAEVKSYLDRIHVGETFTKAKDLMNAGVWERETRNSLVKSAGTVVRMVATSAKIAKGLPSDVRRHTVKSGETPMSIARAVMGDWRQWSALLAANGLDPADELVVGARLVIPQVRA